MADLRQALVSEVAGEVRFDEGARALYATDGSNYRQVPIGVVIPRTTDDIVATVEICRRHEAPILARGAGTSLAGQCCNVAVVIDGSKYVHGVLALDASERWARVLPGTVLDTLRGAANRRGLTFGPDPATHAYCTLGGMLGNNSCGPHSVMAGRTSDNVEELEVLTYDGLRLRVGATTPQELERIIQAGGRRGEIYRGMRDLRDRFADLIRTRYPKLPRRVSGYNLDDLLPENGFHVARALVGSEGTLVTVLEARLRLVPWPAHRALLVIGYPDIFAAADHVPALQSGDGATSSDPWQRPIAIEAVDDLLVSTVKAKHLADAALRLLPRGRAFLLVEFGADTPDACAARARQACASVLRTRGAVDARVLSGLEQQHHVWSLRESALGATARDPAGKNAWEGWEDSAVPVEKLGAYLRELKRTLAAHGYQASLYGHFGQGCVHTRIPFDFGSRAGVANYRAFMQEATDLVVGFGGSFSGEHGDGQARAEYLPKLFGKELVEAFRQFKRIWDPAWRMNPGKVVDAYGSTENLRLGPDFVARESATHLATHFAFPDDGGSFVRATERCVGVGKCRRLDGGTMCPSFMVLKDEEHTTRGRAHLLFEMVRGERLQGWKDDQVKQSLDLCLACKGCKGECPVGVDVATYKAEFLAHYYQGRLRPRAAYVMGLIQRWARLARVAPGLANLVAHAPGLHRLVKRAAQIAPQRELPRFAARMFTEQFAAAKASRARETSREKLVLWPDTFTNHFYPAVGMSAAAVLTELGWLVLVPEQPVCCGRPLYDWGMLKAAKRRVVETLRVLREPLRAGLPIVVLEPSCLSVWKDEARSLFPHDPDVRRLGAQAMLFSEFLARADVPLPRLAGKALLHGHCHEKALGGTDSERKVLERLGLTVETPDAGCCGMAGGFGFERGEKYDVSVRAAERRLLPAVRAAQPDTTIVSDGFSCREQISQLGGRRARHIAELVHDAMVTAKSGRGPDLRARWDMPARVSIGAMAVVVVVTVLGLLTAIRRNRANGRKT
ncbi:MAG TPA: FAD-binding and (Fe-S)-binding domain-containing protein [Polyangia bacterium]|nr:FAD-binding and (Fe-S)-binding domain-containing protein [Polyangia bacterium]